MHVSIILSHCRGGLSQSLFERLVLLGVTPIRLDQQYRMHPALAAFPFSTFYDKLAQDRKLDVAFPWPKYAFPSFFWNTPGQEVFSSGGTSYFNKMEVTNVEEVVGRLFKSGVTPKQIGIIVPYEEQKRYLIQHYLIQHLAVSAYFHGI